MEHDDSHRTDFYKTPCLDFLLGYFNAFIFIAGNSHEDILVNN